MPDTNFLTPSQIDSMLVKTENESRKIFTNIQGLVSRINTILISKERLLNQKMNAVTREIEINFPIELTDVLRKIAEHTDMLSRIAYRVMPSFQIKEIKQIQDLDTELASRVTNLNEAIMKYNQNEELRHWLGLARKYPETYRVQNAIYSEPEAPPGFEWNAVANIQGMVLLILDEIVEEIPTKEAETQQQAKSHFNYVYNKALPIYKQYEKDVAKERESISREITKATGVVPDDDHVREEAFASVNKRYGYTRSPPSPTTFLFDKEGNLIVNARGSSINKPTPESKRRFVEFYDEVFKQQKEAKEARKKQAKSKKMGKSQ